jgi:hypothetical protein
MESTARGRWARPDLENSLVELVELAEREGGPTCAAGVDYVRSLLASRAFCIDRRNRAIRAVRAAYFGGGSTLSAAKRISSALERLDGRRRRLAAAGVADYARPGHEKLLTAVIEASPGRIPGIDAIRKILT